jgi:enamine deaminase RidA (YjgF/YER057c/UK114 family)
MGGFLFCSGQIGCEADTGTLVQGPVQARTVSLLRLFLLLLVVFDESD